MAITLPVSDGSQYQIQPQKIICLGLNYAKHITESAEMEPTRFKDEIPAEPILFPKTPNTLIAPEQPIVIPDFLWDYGFRTTRTDYEGELAVIIAKRATQVAKADAYDYVYGYTCFNDVSQRNFQKHDKAGWFRGKSLDTFGPIGPSVVLRDDLGDPQDLTIQTRLNGDVVQDSNTSHMIFPIAETIEFISKQITLEAGDIIATGTPDGVGPLKNGDVVEIEIEKIGTLRNPVQSPQ